MAATLNGRVYECSSCKEVLTEKIEACWSDLYTPDHLGVCCDCYDAQWGSFKIKLDRPTPLDLSLYDEDDN